MSYEQDYWNSRYERGINSGAGSYGVFVERKLDFIKELEGVKSISEYGCGDFNLGKNVMKIFPEATYIGNDVSDVIVKRNTECFPQAKFTLDKELPPADLVMCVDVLLHIMKEEDVEDLLNRIEKSWTKYLVISAYDRNEEKTNHVRIRKFDHSRFGDPILKEICEEDGEHYLYIFKK